MEAKSKWLNIFQLPKEKNSQPKFLYSVKTSLNNKEEIKTFSHERKLSKFVASRTTLNLWLKEVP